MPAAKVPYTVELATAVAATINKVVTVGTAEGWALDAAKAVLAEHHDTIGARVLLDTADWLTGSGVDPEVIDALRHRADTLAARARPPVTPIRYKTEPYAVRGPGDLSTAPKDA